MPKFKNKKTGKVIEEHLLYYVEKYRNDSNYEEVKPKPVKEVKEKKEEVEEEQPLQ